MKKKKYLAWFFSGESLDGTLSTHSLVIKKLCENFEKVYFINFENLKYFKDWTSSKKEFSYKLNKKFKLPNNIEIFNPKTVKNFKDFMVGKELIAINNIGRSISDLKINFLLARYPIKQVQIINVGFFNLEYKTGKNNSYLKNFIYKLNKNYSHKLTVLLSNLGLIPKIQIRFTSSLKIIKNINQNLIKKILYKLNLFYAKEIILINSSAFDIYKKNEIKVREDKIVLIDSYIDHPEIVAIGDNPSEKKVEEHYYYLNKLINNFSNVYNKKVVICIHPHDNLEIKKKKFPKLKVVQYETLQNIYEAFLVFFFDSSAVVDAILLKKRILTINSNFLGKNRTKGAQEFVNNAGILKINIQDEINTDKDKFLSKLDNAKTNYTNYIKSYIAPDGNNLAYEKIIRTLKERFFSESC